MRYLRDIYQAGMAAGRPVFSFEFFTPKTPDGGVSLWTKAMPALARMGPGFCSVTYGAGGSTRDQTLDLVQGIQDRYGIPGMAHLTCVGSTAGQIAELLAEAKRRGIMNILALRGDPPVGTTGFEPPAGGFRYASELVQLTRGLGGFSIAVAGFPEGHPECREGREVDWNRLKAKVESGADCVVTQLFFENADFYRFRDHMSKRLGVSVPLVPGVIPILSNSQIKRFVSVCGATIPAGLGARLDELADDDRAAAEFGIEFATAQCADLLRNGVPGIHFYTLNRAGSTVRVLENLGVRPDRGGTG
jgi:methylenetetrahydrofolate reductase (NADPH)